MADEAPLSETPTGAVPNGPGWFVLNARDARWQTGDFGAYTRFEGETSFAELGFNIAVLAPGEPSCYYHGEGAQEDFLVLSGECLLIIEDQERPLRQWDFVHCPPWTRHVFVGAGDGPCVLLATGARPSDAVVYPESEVAKRHHAGARKQTRDPAEAYRGVADDTETAYRDGWLADR